MANRNKNIKKLVMYINMNIVICQKAIWSDFNKVHVLKADTLLLNSKSNLYYLFCKVPSPTDTQNSVCNIHMAVRPSVSSWLVSISYLLNQLKDISRILTLMIWCTECRFRLSRVKVTLRNYVCQLCIILTNGRN
jgi:hypothetical protein